MERGFLDAEGLINFSDLLRFIQNLDWSNDFQTKAFQGGRTTGTQGGGELPLIYDGGLGPKVELNPKPKKILNFGNFGTLKKYMPKHLVP